MATLKDGLDPDLAADLDECVKAADAKAVSDGLAPSAFSTLAVVGNGVGIRATLDDQPGSGVCWKRGVGVTSGNKVFTSLVGEYNLIISITSAKLVDDGGRTVFSGEWFGDILTGTWMVRF